MAQFNSKQAVKLGLLQEPHFKINKIQQKNTSVIEVFFVEKQSDFFSAVNNGSLRCTHLV